jgi:hypothetical protein
MFAALRARALVCFAAPSKRWSCRQKLQWRWLEPPCRLAADFAALAATRPTTGKPAPHARQATANLSPAKLLLEQGRNWRSRSGRGCGEIAGQGAPGDGGHFVDCDPHIPEQGPPKGRRYPPPSSSGRRRRHVLVDAIRLSGLYDGFAPGLGDARGWPRRPRLGAGPACKGGNGAHFRGPTRGPRTAKK